MSEMSLMIDRSMHHVMIDAGIAMIITGNF
jgi:hypothetical protein